MAEASRWNERAPAQYKQFLFLLSKTWSIIFLAQTFRPNISVCPHMWNLYGCFGLINSTFMSLRRRGKSMYKERWKRKMTLRGGGAGNRSDALSGGWLARRLPFLARSFRTVSFAVRVSLYL